MDVAIICVMSGLVLKLFANCKTIFFVAENVGLVIQEKIFENPSQSGTLFALINIQMQTPENCF